MLLRYREVFSFTIAELATSSVHALKYWHSELVKALAASGVDERFCTKLMCQYNQSVEIGELLADVLSQYIRTEQPDRLEFEIPEHVSSPTAQLELFMREVQRHHEGWLRLELYHSFLNHVPCDDIITVLDGAR